jgi:D-galactarolactone isomerase
MIQNLLPHLACDCHVHVYEDRFQLAASATFTPPKGALSDYRAVQTQLGLERVVLVQATAYGFDNGCMLEALGKLADSARGVAIVSPEISDAQLEHLHAAGVRGVRYMTIPNSGGLVSWDSIEAMSARIAPEIIERLPSKVVIDHNGKFLEPVAPDDPAFLALLRVLGREGRWIKLSAPYETSKFGPPVYDDVSALSRALVRAHPDRCLWASNWPHPNRLPPPSNLALLELLSDWAPEAAIRKAILVDNPAQAFGF